MSQDYYILKTLNLKDENIHFYKEYVKEDIIKGKRCLVFQAYLTYIPKCKVCHYKSIEKNWFKKSLIRIPSVSKLNTYLSLNKQRYICHDCNKTFTCTSNIINYGCNISNNTKHSIAVDLVKKNEKDIVNYLVFLDNEFEETYQVYQDLLFTFQNNNIKVLNVALTIFLNT